MKEKMIIPLIVVASLLILASPAFAGNLVCTFGQTTTPLAYNYGNSPVAKTLVAPNILAYTTDCEGISCDLVFESFGFENITVDFNKLKPSKVESHSGHIITCADSRQIEGTQTLKREAKRIQNQTKRGLAQAEKDANTIVRKLRRGLGSLLD